MSYLLQCNDAGLARWLTSNPVRNGVGMMTVVCGTVALMWPMVPGDANDSKMEAA